MQACDTPEDLLSSWMQQEPAVDPIPVG